MLGKLLIRYLRPYGWLLLGVLVFQLIAALASLYLPSLNADIIDEGVSKGDTEFIWSTGAFMLAISLGQITAAIIATYFAAKAAMKLGRDIRNDVLAPGTSILPTARKTWRMRTAARQARAA